MLLFTLAFSVLAVLVLRSKRPLRAPQGSTEYHIDNRVVASVLAVLAVSFAVLAWSTGRYFL